MVKKEVLGTRVDLVTRNEALGLIEGWLKEPATNCRMIVTAYSEFFVMATSDRAFRMALEGADLVIPDGIGPLAAVSYQRSAVTQKTIVGKLFAGLKTGVEILREKVGVPVSGYWLFGELTRLAAEKGYRVFILGGFGETARLTAQKLLAKPDLASQDKTEKTLKLKIGYEAGAQNGEQMTGKENDEVIEKINRFKPDLLFVAYGPGKQEKWLAANRGKIKAKVAIGVGGTFDEYLGRVKEAPEVFSRYGIKWLWRLLQQPQRLPRVFKATFVFAWLVFVDSLRKK